MTPTRRSRSWSSGATLAATAALGALLSSPAAAATRCVKPGGGNGCQATITAALAAASDGDTIRVASGTYGEFLLINKTVVLEGGWNATFTARDPAVSVSTIQPPPSLPEEQLSVVRIQGPSSPTVDGFTITGGRADQGFNHGGGVSVRFGSAAVLRGNVIAGNSAYLLGGGVWIQDSPVRLERNRIQDNTAVGDGSVGGGINVESGAVILTSNVIARNHLSGAATKGGGVVLYSPGARMVNNTVDANDGAGVFSDSPLVFSNNIVTGHPLGLDLSTCPAVDCATATVTFNDFFGNVANTAGWVLDGTNRLVDPLLTADHHLTAASPMIDAGTRAGTLPTDRDLDGQPRFMAAGTSGRFLPDIGADEYTGPAQRVVDLDADGADLKLIGPGGNPSPSPNGVNDWIGYASVAADVNGDDRDDLVTAAEDWAVDPDNPPRTTGQLFGIFNAGERLAGTHDLMDTPADLTVACTLNLQHIGSALVSGDLNGDGDRDLVVGSFQDDGAGGGAVFPTVYVFRGGPTFTGTRTLGTATPADFTLRAPGQDFFAFSGKNALATGDLTGDGIADLLVGDALANHGATAGTGAVFVMTGGAGLAGFRDLAATAADYTLYGAAAGAGLGSLAVGRVNVGAQLDLVARTNTAAYVILGPLPGPAPASATTAAASITITGLQAPHSESGSLLVADVTGDGTDDIVLASGNDLLVVPGPLVPGETFDAASRAVLRVTEAFASALASADFTGDGKRDLIVGARQRRRAFVLAGGSGFTGSQAALEIAAAVVHSTAILNVGWDVSAGDLDFDSRADLVVSTFGANVDSHPPGFTDAGLVFVVYGTASGPPPSIADVIPDFDADGRTDVAVYHQASGLWFVRESSTAASYSVAYGGPGYRPVPGMYDGDVPTDVAAYHESSGHWFILQSTTDTSVAVGYGGPGYKPVHADYDGDGRTDIALYHPASGLWFVRQSTTGTTATTGYGAAAYTPVPRDYDADGKADIAVYHESSGLWFIRQTTTGTTFSLGYGGPDLKPYPRDYDGDGKADLAVYYPPTGIWYVRQSATGTTFSVAYGGDGYTPAPARYDADEQADIAVYHEASGLWFIRQSTTGATMAIGYGGSGYTPAN